MRGLCRPSDRLSFSNTGPVKNKRLLYVLLPAVLVIWGLIFQRIWKSARREEESANAVASESPAAAATTVAAQIPRLFLNYTDPFRASSPNTPLATPVVGTSNPLGSYARPLSPAPLNLPVVPAATPFVPIAWPVVKYLGFINNPRLENRVALMTINDKEYSLKLGSNKEEIRISKIWHDSVQVIFKTHKKTIFRAAIN